MTKISRILVLLGVIGLFTFYLPMYLVVGQYIRISMNSIEFTPDYLFENTAGYRQTIQCDSPFVNKEKMWWLGNSTKDNILPLQLYSEKYNFTKSDNTTCKSYYYSNVTNQTYSYGQIDILKASIMLTILIGGFFGVLIICPILLPFLLPYHLCIFLIHFLKKRNKSGKSTTASDALVDFVTDKK